MYAEKCNADSQGKDAITSWWTETREVGNKSKEAVYRFRTSESGSHYQKSNLKERNSKIVAYCKIDTGISYRLCVKLAPVIVTYYVKLSLVSVTNIV